jgi:hypothetical protein
MKRTYTERTKLILKQLKDEDIDRIDTFRSVDLETLEAVMIENKLVTLEDIGQYAGCSRENVRQIFVKRQVNFIQLKKKMKDIIYPEAYPDKIKNLEGEEWRKLDCFDTKFVYYVSNKGRVSKELTKTVHSRPHTYQQLLKLKSDEMGRIRAGISLSSSHKTFYVHILVASIFNIESKKEKHTTVGHDDGILSHNWAENLVWRTKSEALEAGKKRNAA